MDRRLDLFRCLLPSRRQCVLSPVIVIELLNLLLGTQLAILERFVPPVEPCLAFRLLLVVGDECRLELFDQ
jgi:hypothetical protein